MNARKGSLRDRVKPRIYRRDGQWRADLRQMPYIPSLDSPSMLQLRWWLVQHNRAEEAAR